MGLVPKARTTARHLKDVSGYLSGFPESHRSARFEELVVRAVASLLYLRFYDAGTDDPTVQERATWLGVATRVPSKAPYGPDGVIRAHGYVLVVEATRKTGATQWQQEFAPCLRHVADVAKKGNLEPDSVHGLLVCSTLHPDTYTTVRTSNQSHHHRLLPVETNLLASVIYTSALAFSTRHLEVRRVIHKLLDCVDHADRLDVFRRRASSCVGEWLRTVLDTEKKTFVGVKAYEAMVRAGRRHVGESEILLRLGRNSALRHYLKLIEADLGPQLVRDSLLDASLGALIERDPSTGERIFCPVGSGDYCFRSERCARKVREIDAR
jgi:hypothetical protein